MIKKLLFLLILFFQTFGFSQNPALSEKASVSIFTCGRGNELYSTFGHTAIRIKDSINKVWTFYSEPQANAKKVMLHLIAKCEQMLAKAKSDLIKKYPDLGKEPARYASLEEDIKFDLPAYSEPVVVGKRSEKGKKISSRAPAYQPLSLSNDQEDDEEIPLETRGRVGRNLRNMSDEERAKLFGDIE